MKAKLGFIVVAVAMLIFASFASAAVYTAKPYKQLSYKSYSVENSKETRVCSADGKYSLVKDPARYMLNVKSQLCTWGCDKATGTCNLKVKKDGTAYRLDLQGTGTVKDLSRSTWLSLAGKR